MPRPAPTGDRRFLNLDARSVKNSQISAALRRTSCPDESNRLLNELVEENIPIADSIAGRYVSRGIPKEDLRQVARLAREGHPRVPSGARSGLPGVRRAVHPR